MAKAKKADSTDAAEKKPAAAAKAKAPAEKATPAAKTAEAKKPATPAKAAEEKKPVAKPAGKKAPAVKATSPAQPAGVPMIDTNFAAQSAAKALLNRAISGGGAAQAAQGGKESASFKNFKDQIAKPKSASLSNLLGPAVDAKKSASTFLDQQRGHNQTQGGFNKTGVPRRTNG
jgi:DnaK suppressor protein